jgi:hypothetical protein
LASSVRIGSSKLTILLLISKNSSPKTPCLVTPVTRFTIKKGFIGYDEFSYEVFYDLPTGKFYVEQTTWELIPPPNFLFNTGFRVEVTSVNGIFPDDVNSDNSDVYYVIPSIGNP